MKENNDQVLKLFIVSDSIGETAQRMIHATLTQFPDLTQVEIKKFPISRMNRNFSMFFSLLKNNMQLLQQH